MQLFSFLSGHTALLWQDVKTAMRMLGRNGSFSLSVVLALALGVGTATALHAVVHAMWLRPLPYHDPGRLVSVTTYFPSYTLDALLSPDYAAWQGTRSLGPLAAYSTGTAALVGPEETIKVRSAGVSGNLFSVLGVKAALGRPIQAADDNSSAPCVAMVSDGVWRERFGAKADVIGRAVHLDGKLCTLVGVLPLGFRLPDERRIDIIMPLALEEGWLRHGMGGAKLLRGMARLQSDRSLTQAYAELSTRLAQSRAQDSKLYGPDVSLRLLSLQEYAVRDVRTAALMLTVASTSILLIASTNAASLLVARAVGRSREMAVRAAVGASAQRIVQHLLAEGMILALAGVAGGLLLADALLALVQQAGSAWLPDITVVVDRDVLLTTIPVALLCSLACSLAPALPLSRLRVRRALVVAELSLSLVLLVAAALLLQSLVRLRSVAPGFNTGQLITASFSLDGTRFAENTADLRRELSERLQRTPGTIAVSFADALPPTEWGRLTSFSRADRPKPDPLQRTDNVVVRLVDESYFTAMGISPHQGRLFTRADLNSTNLVAVVNQTLADHYFAGENSLGKQVDGLGLPWKTVVGVVADARNNGLRQTTRPEIYLPFREPLMRQGGGVTHNVGLHVAIRTASDLSAAIATLRGHVRGIDRNLLATVHTMDEQWAELTTAPRFQAMVIGAFAVLAVVMACLGIYGVLSHMVVLRRREMGIRLALGAQAAAVQRLIVREAVLLACGGVVVGLGGTIASSKLLTSLLYEIKPLDPLTVAGAAALLLTVAVLASAVPARRASREDPIQALRTE